MKIFLTIVVLLVLTGLGWGITVRLVEQKRQQAPVARSGPAPVEVAAVERGAIELRRTFSGTLEAPTEFVVAPKVSGRIERLAVDMSDVVRRGQILAELDDDEYVQAVAQAQAELAVAQANLGEAISRLEIAVRELDRVRTLQQRGVASESQYDVARSDELAKEAAVEVARAQVRRAEAFLESARIRLSYTKITASWADGDDERVVAERYVDEGVTVAANTPLMSIVDLDPINAIVFVTERDYGRMSPDQPVALTTDAYPREVFAGRIARVAPVFRQASRQARIELVVDNPGHRLRPGMFVRAEVILDRAEDAVIVPTDALVARGGTTGVFVVNADGESVSYREVEVGIRDGERVAVVGEGIEGRVVTLGQQLIADGAKITIPELSGVEKEASAR